ncbi:hypothetical protein AB1Y20_009391 [Prymnesium parvum]|uniref:Uncharacterized protein n=1 Tax=Prymnesium parvum TaxID=97485 RepID=A0AB34K3Q1_PRYPA|eukprot:CAMPEP_0182823468 /NCGR_PEP_ID=MMETSP0006_2-20121128/14767_1 /TAXON_ID=97485 /ORGANISM="Prymnesium parvum, Strain Texoma1" /LENGTH=431 /DNA_ID=CAMNT_0024950389 /DNA_START=24 /DNA_END=1319 /DNA_ORIENTATION=-
MIVALSTAGLALLAPPMPRAARGAGAALVVPRAPFAKMAAEPNPSNVPCVDEICDDAEPVKEDIPWYKKGSAYAEASRQYRRTVYMHDEWVKHRSSERFFRNVRTIGSSGVAQSLGTELSFVTGTAIFCVLINMLLTGYQDFSGVMQEAPFAMVGKYLGPISLPALPFTISMPALSLLLVFRTNTGYFRWNEARTLWGGIINSCRNVVRQANTYFPDDPRNNALKGRLAANTAAYAKALRNFLRGPTNDEVLRKELYELVDKGVMDAAQADACMAASNRPMFCLSAMSANIREADLNPIDRARIDSSITTLVDLTGANERIFKSPIPLVYTRHTARFLSVFTVLLPFALWPVMGSSWNHWATVPATDVIAFFLFGIEEIGIQIEEPFSILPLEALCNGAIAATMDEMIACDEAGKFDFDPKKFSSSRELVK